MTRWRRNDVESTISSARFGIMLGALVALAIIGLSPVSAEIQETSGDLLDEIESIRSNVPGRDSEGFVPPASGEIDLWRTIAEAFLNEDIGTVDSLITAWFPAYQLFLFTDTANRALSRLF